MSRLYHRGWQDTRPFTNRVRMFLPGHDDLSVRLQFDTPDGRRHELYACEEDALTDFHKFIDQHTTTPPVAAGRRCHE